MHEYQDLSIATATITIKVIQVAGHKMTKATFRQIQYRKLEIWPGDATVLGWVNDDGPKLLWVKQGKMYRSCIQGWISTTEDGTKTPVTEYFDQLFIAT